jgi:hypothetical protein
MTLSIIAGLFVALFTVFKSIIQLVSTNPLDKKKLFFIAGFVLHPIMVAIGMFTTQGLFQAKALTQIITDFAGIMLVYYILIGIW